MIVRLFSAIWGVDQPFALCCLELPPHLLTYLLLYKQLEIEWIYVLSYLLQYTKLSKLVISSILNPQKPAKTVMPCSIQIQDKTDTSSQFNSHDYL